MNAKERDQFLKDLQAKGQGVVRLAFDRLAVLKQQYGFSEGWDRLKAMHDAGTLVEPPKPSELPPAPVIQQQPRVIERVIEVPAPRPREPEVKADPVPEQRDPGTPEPPPERKKRSSSSAPARRVVEWVFENLDPATPIDESRAPSRGAVAYCKTLREDPELRADFYKGNWAKLMPTKAELDREAQLRDDGRSHKDLIARVRAAHDRFRSRQPVQSRT